MESMRYRCSSCIIKRTALLLTIFSQLKALSAHLRPLTYRSVSPSAFSLKVATDSVAIVAVHRSCMERSIYQCLFAGRFVTNSFGSAAAPQCCRSNCRLTLLFATMQEYGKTFFSVASLSSRVFVVFSQITTPRSPLQYVLKPPEKVRSKPRTVRIYITTRHSRPTIDRFARSMCRPRRWQACHQSHNPNSSSRSLRNHNFCFPPRALRPLIPRMGTPSTKPRSKSLGSLVAIRDTNIDHAKGDLQRVLPTV